MKKSLLANGAFIAMLLGPGFACAQSAGAATAGRVAMTTGSGDKGDRSGGGSMRDDGSMRNGGDSDGSGVGSAGTTRGKNHSDTNRGIGAGGGVVLLEFYAPRYGYYGATYYYGQDLRCYSDNTPLDFSGQYCNSSAEVFTAPNDDSND